MTQSSDDRVAPFVGKKMPWSDRQELIHKQFPGVRQFDWGSALSRDDGLFAAIMRDVLKVDQAIPGRSGPRPALDPEQARASYQRFMGDDFCTLPFPEAFRLLTHSRSFTQIARKTNLSRTQVYRLMQGSIEPDPETMTQIAEAYKKHPSFFAEYRSLYVLAHIEARLLDMPEATITYYRKISSG